jgi:transcriptional antiterminator NusG
MSEEPEVLDKEIEEAEVVREGGPAIEEQGAIPESLQPGDLAAALAEEDEASEAGDGQPEAELPAREIAAEEVDEAASEEPEAGPELGEAATLEAEPVEEEVSDAAEEQLEAELTVQESAGVEVDEAASEEPEAGPELGEAASLEAEPVEGDAPDAGDEQPEAELAAQETAAEEADEPADGAEETPARDEGRYWYVIHSYSGYENKVKKNLESRIESMGMEDYIFEVVVPTEDVVELRDGRRRTVEQRIFPGYILVDMILTDESWFVVRNTPSVTGFVGSGNQPTPLRDEEADNILRRMEEEAPKVKVSFRIGDAVRIVDGPFTDFMGTVDDLNLERGKVRLLVSFFGRETPVELDFLQVETQ